MYVEAYMRKNTWFEMQSVSRNFNYRLRQTVHLKMAISTHNIDKQIVHKFAVGHYR